MESFSIANLQAHWVDLAMFGWLAVSMLIGLLRGLVFEVLALLGWGVAYFGAHWLAPIWAPYLPIATPGSELNHVASFVCAFVAILLAWGLLARLVRLLVRATPLSLLDRGLGAGFGMLRGVLVLMLVATLVTLTPMAGSKAWQQSQLAPWLSAARQGLNPLLPNELSRHLPAPAGKA